MCVIGDAAIETFSTPPPRNSCRSRKNSLFDTTILDYISRVKANFVLFSKIRHHGNISRLDGKNVNASIYLCHPANVLFDAKILEIPIIEAEKFCTANASKFVTMLTRYNIIYKTILYKAFLRVHISDK